MSKGVLKGSFGMKTVLFFMMISLVSTVAIAQDLPRIAIYVTGNIGEDEKSALGTVMLSALINSGRYRGIERSSAFMAEVEREQATQRSGAIDDSHISELGKQFGVRFVCIAAITPAFGSYQVSARIVDVETAEVVHIGNAASPLNLMKDLEEVSEKVVVSMFGKSKRTASNISAGGGAFFLNDFGGGVLNEEYTYKMPFSSIGLNIFLDVVYAEVSVGLLFADGTVYEDIEYSFTALTFGILGKYPIRFNKITVFPAVGVDYKTVLSGGETYGGDYTYEWGRYAGSYSALWFKLGGGADIDLNENIYLRIGLLYGMRATNESEKETIEDWWWGEPKANIGHGFTLRAGIGYRF